MSDIPEFNPNSMNAMIARVLVRLDRQDQDTATHRSEVKALLDAYNKHTDAHRTEITSLLESLRTDTNKRVTAIERWILTTKTKLAMLAIVGSGVVYLLTRIIEHYWK